MMHNMKLVAVLLLVAACLVVAGCDPVTRHKALSTVFDGVPSLPPTDQLCTEFANQRVAAVLDDIAGKKAATTESGAVTQSKHLPYQEKRCNGCHDKTKKGGLVAPKNELCYVCHTGFIKGSFVHGPVAVSDCLACHLPHTSSYPSLLKFDKSVLCATCHKETRVASAMHDRLAAKKMDCVDCHDPHFGRVMYFLK